MPQILKDWLRRIAKAFSYTVVCMGFFLIGLFVLNQAKIIPDADMKNFTIGVASSIAGSGFVFWIVFMWGMDKTSERLKKMEDEQVQQRQLIADFKAEIHTLNTTNAALLQQLVDKANQPTTNTLTTPTNQTVPDQTALVSNGHASNKN